MSLVPLEQTYIIANYREVALRHVRPGQAVKIHVDAYDIDLNGVVDSIAPASGTVFSPIPPDNATGNFTKIVQRLPVKILVAPNQPLARLLRVGLSVETTIQTDFAPVVGDAAAQRTTSSADSQPQLLMSGSSALPDPDPAENGARPRLSPAKCAAPSPRPGARAEPTIDFSTPL